MEQPFFSIIIPTYNRKNHLTKAVASLLSQNFDPFEIIIVDDGSTDDTYDALQDIIARNTRIKYFRKTNEERSIARNFGIERAKGRYIGFLDSDDFVYPTHLEAAYALLHRNDFPEVGHMGYAFVDNSDQPISVVNNFSGYKEKLIHENILHGNAIFIRKDVAEQIKFIPSKHATVSEDWYVWIRLASRFPIHFDETVTAAVVQHDARSLSNIDPDKLVASTEVIIEYLRRDEAFNTTYRGQVNYHFANHYTLISLILALTKRRRSETIKYLCTAMRYDPSVIFRRRFLASLKHLL